MTIQYAAKRSLTAGHAADQDYVLEAELSDAIRSRQVEKNPVRAVSGRSETLYHRSDTLWQLTFAPVKGHEKDLITEFLDSTASEEEFLIWLYGDEVAPLMVRRSDEGYQWQPFMRAGGVATDLFTVSITVTEIEQ